LRRPSCVDGLSPSRRRRKRKATRSSKRQHYDTSYVINRLPFSTCSNDFAPIIEPSGGASGQASDIAIHAKEILRIRKALTGIYQKHCAHPDEAEVDGLQRFGEFRLGLPGYTRT
jgi:hypothetical protein